MYVFLLVTKAFYSSKKISVLLYNRSTGTVHTCAKARHTSAAIWRISMSSRFMSVNYFPYLSVVTNSENNPCIQTVIRIATKI